MAVCSESALQHLHGREFNSLNQEYTLPADAPEMERLRTQHKMLSLAFGGLYPEVYSEVIRQRLEPRDGETPWICDMGSGSGDWIADMAREFPHAEALGIDLAPSAPTDCPAHVRFKVADVTKDLSEYRGRFDLIQSRCIGSGINDYRAFMDTMMQSLRPGGVFMAIEGCLKLFDEDLNLVEPKDEGGLAKIFWEVASRLAPSDGSANRRIDHLEDWFKEESELKDIRSQTIYTPIGWSGSPELCKEPAAAGQLMLANTIVFVSAWKPMLVATGVPEADVDRWIALAIEEMQNPETFKVFVKWIVACGTKRQ